MLPARVAELLRLQSLGVLLFILRRCVVAILALAALQRNRFSHKLFLMHQIFCFDLTNIHYDCQYIIPANHHGVLSPSRCKLNPETFLCFLLHLKRNRRRILCVPPSLPKNPPAFVAQMEQNKLAFEVRA
jgi:hypothetical protein